MIRIINFEIQDIIINDTFRFPAQAHKKHNYAYRYDNLVMFVVLLMAVLLICVHVFG